MPEDKIPDRNASDIANIDFSIKGMIQTKKGKELYGQEITAPGKCLRGFLYKKNFGELKRVLLRVRDDGTNSHLEWFNPSHPDTPEGQWETLVANLTKDAVMGFAAFNQTGVNQLIFCNAEDNFSEWNGAVGKVASVTSNTITHGGENDLADEGFTATGSVLIDGTEYAYTGLSGKTFTGVTPNPTSQNPSAGVGIAQKPDTTTHSALDKGNILVVAAARLWLAGKKNNESSLFYSEVGNATNFTAGTNPDDPGFEDFPDGGGPITLIDVKDNKKLIIHKEDGIMQFQLDYTATAKIPQLSVLTLADDSGAANQKAGAGLNQASFFTTRVEGLKSLARAVEGSDLNLDSISDTILPTIADYDFSDAATVYFAPKRVIYVACKTDSGQSYNNKIIAFYIQRGADGQFGVDISIDDGFVADWVVDRNTLYAMSSIDQNTYKWFDQYSDVGVAQNHKWVSKEFTFNEPARQKEFNKLYIEGFIRTHTKIKVSIIYGILGSGTSVSKIISWDDDFVSKQKVSALGTDVIGTVSLGASSKDVKDSHVFSVPIHFNANADTRYKIKIETYYDEETTEESYWAISNLAPNPSIKGLSGNKIINSNV